MRRSVRIGVSEDRVWFRRVTSKGVRRLADGNGDGERSDWYSLPVLVRAGVTLSVLVYLLVLFGALGLRWTLLLGLPAVGFLTLLGVVHQKRTSRGSGGG